MSKVVLMWRCIHDDEHVHFNSYEAAEAFKQQHPTTRLYFGPVY